MLRYPAGSWERSRPRSPSWRRLPGRPSRLRSPSCRPWVTRLSMSASAPARGRRASISSGGVHIAVAAEAFSLAANVGVDMRVLLEIVSGSSASSWMLRDRGPRMLQEEPEVTSAVDIFVKDLGIVLQAGRDTKAAMPLAAVAHQMFLATSGRGDGNADDSQVIRAYKALNGTKVR